MESWTRLSSHSEASTNLTWVQSELSDKLEDGVQGSRRKKPGNGKPNHCGKSAGAVFFLGVLSKPSGPAERLDAGRDDNPMAASASAEQFLAPCRPDQSRGAPHAKMEWTCACALWV